MAEPGNFEQAHLHQVVKVAANLVRYDLWGHPSAQGGQGRLLHDHLAELELELDQRGKIRHMLRGPPPPKLQGRVDQPPRHGERGHRLQHDLKHCVVHDCASLSSGLSIPLTSSPPVQAVCLSTYPWSPHRTAWLTAETSPL